MKTKKMKSIALLFLKNLKTCQFKIQENFKVSLILNRKKDLACQKRIITGTLASLTTKGILKSQLLSEAGLRVFSIEPKLWSDMKSQTKAAQRSVLVRKTVKKKTISSAKKKQKKFKKILRGSQGKLSTTNFLKPNPE